MDACNIPALCIVTLFCRSRREVPNEYLVAKIGSDTVENKPFKVCPLSVYRNLLVECHLLELLCDCAVGKIFVDPNVISIPLEHRSFRENHNG